MRKLSIFLLGIFILCGCNSKDLDALIGGKYDGILIKSDNSGTVQNFITSTVSKLQDGKYVLLINSLDQQKIWTLQVSIDSKKSVTLIIPELADWSQPVSFSSQKSNTDQCFVTNSQGKTGRFCISQTEVTLDIKNQNESYTLNLDFLNKSSQPVNEPPAEYTINQLITRALNQSFATQFVNESLVQSKLTARNSLLNLLPHFSTNTFIALFSVSFTSALKDIGDLTPFLLPSRWMRAAEDKNLYQAEFNAWVTAKADAGNIVEGLALLFLENAQTLKKLEANKILVTSIRDQIRQRESPSSGIYPIGASNEISVILVRIDETISQLKNLQKNETAALAYSAGFVNPEAISTVTATADENAVDNPTSTDLQQLDQLGLSRSYELKQIAALIKAAQKDKSRRIFNWIDPDGDKNGGVGFGFPSYIQIVASEMRQLDSEGKSIQAGIQQKIKSTLDDIELAETDRANALKGRDLEESEIKRYSDYMDMGLSFAMASLVNALEGKVADDIRITSSGYKYLVAWSKLNRLIFAGPYINLANGDLLLPAFDADIGSSTH